MSNTTHRGLRAAFVALIATIALFIAPAAMAETYNNVEVDPWVNVIVDATEEVPVEVAPAEAPVVVDGVSEEPAVIAEQPVTPAPVEVDPVIVIEEEVTTTEAPATTTTTEVVEEPKVEEPQAPTTTTEAPVEVDPTLPIEEEPTKPAVTVDPKVEEPKEKPKTLEPQVPVTAKPAVLEPIVPAPKAEEPKNEVPVQPTTSDVVTEVPAPVAEVPATPAAPATESVRIPFTGNRLPNTGATESTTATVAGFILLAAVTIFAAKRREDA